MGSVTLSLPEAYDLALAVLSANGFSADHAAHLCLCYLQLLCNGCIDLISKIHLIF